VLIDVHPFGLTGRQAEQALLDSGIVTNRNAISSDPNGAWYTSGVRIGTPALTSRGLGAAEMDQIADLIHTVLAGTTPDATSKAKFTLDPALASRVSKQASELLAPFPLYPSVSLA
jgi:glycine hydroxymethyltransferase